MEIKVTNRKRFFVKVSKTVKENLSYIFGDKRRVYKENTAYKGKTVSVESTLLEVESTSIEDYIVGAEVPTFSKLVKKIMEEKGMTSKDIYKNSLINRKLFSALNVNDDYIPSRETAIMYCIALNLGYDESVSLLKSAGYSFYEFSNFDRIIKYFLDNKIFNIDKINDALYYYTNKCLGYK